MVYWQIDSLTLPAHDSSCISDISAVHLVSDQKYNHSCGATLLCFIREILIILFVGDLKCPFDAILYGIIEIFWIFYSMDNIFQLMLQFKMKVFGAKLGTWGTTMAIKNGIVSNLNSIIKINKLLNILIIIFHVISLTDITYNSCVKSLY